MFTACLSPLEHKLQEGESFVLFTTISPVPEEPPHILGWLLVYIHVDKHGCVPPDMFLHVDYYISLSLGFRKAGSCYRGGWSFAFDFSAEQLASLWPLGRSLEYMDIPRDIK